MELEVAGERTRIAPCVCKPRLGQPCPREAGKQRVAAATRRLQRVRGQSSGERSAAEQSDERSLLVGEVDRFKRIRKVHLSGLRCSQHLERSDDAERAVEAAAVRDAIEVRAE